MTSEAEWRNLCNGVEEVLGSERADTLMSRISLHPIDELATKPDMNRRFEQVDQRFDKLEVQVGRLHDRLDHLQLNLIGGLLAVIAAIVLQTVFG